MVTEDGYAEQLELTGTKVIPNVEGEWNGTGTLDENGETSIDFDAGASSDPDAQRARDHNRWTVYNDGPTANSVHQRRVHRKRGQPGEWTYTFRNVTIDAFGEQQAEIRIELIVTDGTEEDVSKFRFYFVVVPAGFGEEPVVTLDWGKDSSSRVVEDTLSVSGSGDRRRGRNRRVRRACRRGGDLRTDSDSEVQRRNRRHLCQDQEWPRRR